MRVSLTANAAGHLRLVTQRELKRAKPRAAEFPQLLVGNKLLQDCISKPYTGPRPGYGKTPSGRRFTRVARMRLQEFGAIADRTSKNKVVFLTGTLPGSSQVAVETLAQWSAWIVSRLSQWMRDRYKTAAYFGVWEYQKRGALHIHLACVMPSAIEATSIKQIWKKRWIALLDGVHKRSGIDLFEKADGDSWQKARWKCRTDAQTVYKSVGAYLSKYLSKQGNAARKENHFPPSSWWFAAKVIRREANDSRWKITLSGWSPGAAANLHELVGGWLVECSDLSFPIHNRWDFTYKGVIAMNEPIHSSMLFRHIADSLFCLAPEEASVIPHKILSVSRLAAYWNGSCLTTEN